MPVVGGTPAAPLNTAASFSAGQACAFFLNRTFVQISLLVRDFKAVSKLNVQIFPGLGVSLARLPDKLLL
jgi:hypothetical protein